jgi:hypothetical protein
LFCGVPQLACRALFRPVGVAFVAVAADQLVGLVGQPLALRDAVAQRLLVALQLSRLPFPAAVAAFLFRDDDELLRGPTADPAS